MEILKCFDLWAGYGDKTIIEGLNLSIRKGTFNILCGRNAAGKSTLLKILRKLDAYYGIKVKKGDIIVNGKNLTELEVENMGSDVGIIFDTPREQLIELTVERDIISAGIYMGFTWNEIKNRFEKVVNQLKIGHLLTKETDKISNGESQKVALAGQLLLYPSILLLDEPTSNLDPVSKQALLSDLKSLTKKGITILMVSHRLEEEAKYADNVLFFDKKIMLEGSPEEILQNPVFYNNYPPRGHFILSHKLRSKTGSFIIAPEALYKEFDLKVQKQNNPEIADNTPAAIRFDNVTASYPNDYVALNDFSLSIPKNKITCIFGHCGSGKTSIARACLKALKIEKGKIEIAGKDLKDYKNDLYSKIFYIPQNPKEMFFEPKVEEEVLWGLEDKSIESKRALEALEKVELDKLRDKEPDSLSFGQQRLLTIAIAYANKPEIIFFDEPELSLDPLSLNKVIEIILQLRNEGLTIIVLTHDVNTFAYLAEYAAILAEGKVLVEGLPSFVFSDEQLIEEANLLKPLFIPEIYKLGLKPPITWKEMSLFLVK